MAITGRPTDYSLDKAQLIAQGIANAIPLVRICEPDDMPAVSTVYKWLHAHSDFVEMYARAREDQADYLASQIIDIADNSDLDHNDRRVRVDARKWISSKLKPRAYGERLDLGNADSKPFEIIIK